MHQFAKLSVQEMNEVCTLPESGVRGIEQYTLRRGWKAIRLAPQLESAQGSWEEPGKITDLRSRNLCCRLATTSHKHHKSGCVIVR